LQIHLRATRVVITVTSFADSANQEKKSGGFLSLGRYLRANFIRQEMGFGMSPITEATRVVTHRIHATAVIAAATAGFAVAVSPVADANVAGCLPLNGAQLTASSHEDTNYLGITYDSNVTYWYQDGAVNWHRTVDGGSWNLTHTNTSGTVPAAPGSSATIPGTDSGRRDGNGGSPIVVTVCTQ
jgi:hypothetical protein